MPKGPYDWKRFWCPREGNFDLTDQGYLTDPTAKYGSCWQPDVVEFRKIAELPCLVLLGEPGIGKSTTVKAEESAAAAVAAKSKDATLFFNLGEYESELPLRQELFDNSVFKLWLAGIHRLHLFLDSLDECLLRIRTVTSLLDRELQRLDLRRLSLRIVCRTADWPVAFEPRLKELFGDSSVAVYELVPLTKPNVETAAKAEDIDADAFLAEVSRLGIVPLAIKPLTLRFLLNTYTNESRLPSSQAEAYVKGLRLLCEEANENRRAAKQIGRLSPAQRLAVASRIAAMMVFGGRSAVWTEVDFGNKPSSDIGIYELISGNETSDGNEIAVGESEVRDALSTGLFSARGPGRLGFAHQTYGDFLAAYYLVNNNLVNDNLRLKQILDLILIPEDKKVFPQLRAVAAWLASLSADVYNQLITRDPEVLFYVTGAADAERANLVEGVMQLYDSEQLLDVDWELRREYPKLKHPGLAAQLRPYVADKAKGVVVRRVAIDLAEECELTELESELLALALDSSDDHHIRVRAVHALSEIGSEAVRAQLLPLAKGEAGDDPDDELKGYALAALWPKLISFQQLTQLLTPRSRDSFHGGYSTFLWYHVDDGLQEADLIEALEWIESLKEELSTDLEILSDRVILKAWKAQDPNITKTLARVLFKRLQRHDGLIGSRSREDFEKGLEESDERRRALVLEMLWFSTNSSADLLWLVHGPTRLITDRDLPWLLGCPQIVTENSVQRALAHLTMRVFDRSNTTQIDAIIEAAQTNPVLADEFSGLLKPIELGSEQAEQLKSQYAEQQKWNREIQPDVGPDASKLSQDIEQLLQQAESGDISAFWRLHLVLSIEPGSKYCGHEFDWDLTKLPGWKNSSEQTRSRIVEACKPYLVNADPQNDQWLGTNTFFRPAGAGFRALALLQRQDPAWLSTLEPGVWAKWAGIILAFPHYGDLEAQAAELACQCYAKAPEAVLEALRVLIKKEAEQFDEIFVLRTVEDCWDDRLNEVVCQIAKESSLKASCMRSLLSMLLDHGSAEAKAFAESLVTLPVPAEKEATKRSVLAAQALLGHASDAGWSTFFPVITKDCEFGKDVVLGTASRDSHTAKIATRLNAAQLADLYLWLAGAFPESEDPQFEEAHMVGPRESVGTWRNSILRSLAAMGTREAVDAIARIKAQLNADRLKWTLYNAAAALRQKTWTPVDPKHVLTLAKESRARLVDSGAQLLEVIIESLKSVESSLKGVTPAARDIWDKCEHGFRPVSENELSDYLKRHLSRELKEKVIVINREVEVRASTGPGTGQRTDIQIDATAKSGSSLDVITAVVETKGCWNPELWTAMKTQLLDKYLKGGGWRYGLYVVGWFNCNQWDDKDSRKAQEPKLEIPEVQVKLDKQAHALSDESVSVRALVIDTALH